MARVDIYSHCMRVSGEKAGRDEREAQKKAPTHSILVLEILIYRTRDRPQGLGWSGSSESTVRLWTSDLTSLILGLSSSGKEECEGSAQ